MDYYFMYEELTDKDRTKDEKEFLEYVLSTEVALADGQSRHLSGSLDDAFCSGMEYMVEYDSCPTYMTVDRFCSMVDNLTNGESFYPAEEILKYAELHGIAKLVSIADYSFVRVFFWEDELVERLLWVIQNLDEVHKDCI